MSVAAQIMCSLGPDFFGAADSDVCEQFLPLVREISRKIHRQLPKHIELDDLVSAGTLGLVKALQKCGDRCEAEFSAYVRQRVRGAILDSLRAGDWAPRSVRRQGRALQKARAELQSQGDVVSEEQLAATLGTTSYVVRKTLSDLQQATVGSLHECVGESGDLLIDQVADTKNEDGLGRLLAQESREGVVAMLDSLPERERLVLKLSFYEELTLKEIGQVLCLTESRVSQLRSRALGRLRTSFSSQQSFIEQAKLTSVKSMWLAAQARA